MRLSSIKTQTSTIWEKPFSDVKMSDNEEIDTATDQDCEKYSQLADQLAKLSEDESTVKQISKLITK